MPEMYEWEYMKALETLIAIRDRAREKGWKGKWVIYIHEAKKQLKLEIEDNHGVKHWFYADRDGNYIPARTGMSCFERVG